MESNGLLTDAQNGFRKGRCTQDTIFKIVQDVNTVLNSGQTLGAIYIDFKKAFDTIDHSKLVVKLGGYGLHESVVHWFKDYLVNRMQDENFS